MSKLVSGFIILGALGFGVRAVSIYLKPSNQALREYRAAFEAGNGWVSERDRCRSETKIARAFMAENDVKYSYWYASSRRACRQAARVAAEALL